MTAAPKAPTTEARAEALAWLAEELDWERRLDVLRRPRRQPHTPVRRSTTAATLARAS